MNIFSEVKEQLTTRQVAESYGLRIRKNGVACCPFHDDRHPSMKVDKNYHCFACGVGGDVIDYTARMYGLSQYDAAKKLIEDFGLHVQTKKNALSFSSSSARACLDHGCEKQIFSSSASESKCSSPIGKISVFILYISLIFLYSFSQDC